MASWEGRWSEIERGVEAELVWFVFGKKKRIAIELDSVPFKKGQLD